MMSQKEIGIFPCSNLPMNQIKSPGAATSPDIDSNSIQLYNGPPATGTMGFGQSNANSSKKKGRRKIKIEFIEDKSKRHVTLSKRKAGIMKKAYELSTLTGTQCLLLIASETGHVYTFSTPKLQPLITKPEGKNLIQACLNASIPPQPTDGAEDGQNPSFNTTVDAEYASEPEKQPKIFTPPPVLDRPPSGVSVGGLPIQLPAGSSHLFTQHLQQIQSQYGSTPYSALLSSAAVLAAAGAANGASAPASVPSPTQPPLPFMWPSPTHRDQHSNNGE
jgi:pheromone receptor transcription factor